MMSLHRGRFVVVHLCSNFPIDPHNFSRGANFYQKLPFLATFWAVRPHFKAIEVKFGTRVRPWGFLPQAKYCEKYLRGYTPFVQIYTKKYQFWRFLGLKICPKGVYPLNQFLPNLAWGRASEVRTITPNFTVLAS